MKRLIVFLGLILILNGDSQAMVVTSQQADSVIQATTISASASAFFGLLTGNLTSDMTLINFTGYYTPYFMPIFNTDTFQSLLSSYLNDIITANYTQAQVDLIRLAASTFRNINKILAIIQAANSPWGAGKFLNLSGVGTVDQQIVQFFVNQFAILYPKIMAGSNPSNNPTNPGNSGNVVTPLNPTNKVVDPNGAMDLEAANDNGVISNILNDALQALGVAKSALEQAMDDIQTEALTDPQITEEVTMQIYLGTLFNKVKMDEGAGEPNAAIPIVGIQTILNNYTNQINNAKNTAVSNFNILAAQGGSSGKASGYINSINSIVTNDINQLTEAYAGIIDDLNILQNSIVQAIVSKSGNGDSNNGGGVNSANKDEVIEIATSILGAAGLSIPLILKSVRAFLNKQVNRVICSIIPAKCPPPDPVGDAALEAEGLPTDLPGLLKLVGSSSSADIPILLTSSPALLDGIYGVLMNDLGITSEVLADIIGAYVGSSGTKVVSLMTSINKISVQLDADGFNINLSSTFQAIGKALTNNPNAQTTDLIAATESIITISNSIQINLGGAGGIGRINLAEAQAFNVMYQSDAQFKQALIDQIKQTAGLTEADFENQLQILKNINQEDLSEAQQELLANEIAQGESILQEIEANEIPSPFEPVVG